MNIVLSRKGFDTVNGAIPSPIFPDGTMLSFPIPYKYAPVSFQDVSCKHGKISSLIDQLGRGRNNVPSPETPCHLDPDLRKDSIARHENWRPAFGQAGNPQSHLFNNGVDVGDIFLFFGLFQEVEHAGLLGWTYKLGSKPVHAIYGWMQVGKRISGSAKDWVLGEYLWLESHPHMHDLDKWENNTIYISDDSLKMDAVEGRLLGSGVFQFHDDLVLTAKGHTVSKWTLPKWVGDIKNSKFSIKNSEQHLERSSEDTILKTTGIWQEMVINTEDYPLMSSWVANIIRMHGETSSE